MITDLSFTTLFLNCFGVSPAEAGVTVEGGHGTRNGHAVQLGEVNGKLTGWQVDGVHLIDFRIFGRNDPRGLTNMDLLAKATD